MLKSEIQHQYWVTKKAVQRKLGGKEDENIVASDGELDSKIELFKSVSDTCSALYRIIDQYQERVCILAQEENGFGKFLREVGKESVTTGKLMSNTGKAISYCGQQRMTIRIPLLRLHHEVDTFRGRAVADTQSTISLMEKERTEYRGALSWMKSVSTQLDPDTGRGLDKFRKAQKHVKSSKTKFDKYTLDCLEKIDLLAAARCNMFSLGLVAYQNSMLQYAKKSDETYKTTLKSLSKGAHYNFTILKELTQANNEEDTGVDEVDKKDVDNDQMLFFQEDYKDENKLLKKEKRDQITEQDNDDKILSDPSESDSLLQGISELNMSNFSEDKNYAKKESSANVADLLGLKMDDDFSDFLSSPAPFMPSNLLMSDLSAHSNNNSKVDSLFSDFLQNLPKESNKSSLPETGKDKKVQPSAKSGKDVSAWFQLFAELDPLSNPDAIPSKSPHNSQAA